MLQFPNINPIAIDLGFIKISWYAISYIAGILSSWYFLLKIIKIKKIKITDKIVSDLISNCMIGIILGGRLGYVIFYNPEYYFENIIEIFKIWNGGMSFHGGLIGVILAIIYSSWTSKIPIIIFSDLISIVSPIGLFFGIFRFFIEYFREPDGHIGLIYFNFSMGQILSFPMIISGLYFMTIFYNKK